MSWTRAFLLQPAPNLRCDDNGRRLVGGSPPRVMTLSRAGADLVAAWFAGAPVGSVSAHQSLARRLIESGMANARSDGPLTEPARVAVVIPVKDDPAGLAATLDALSPGDDNQPGARYAGVRPDQVVIVDDGSEVAVDVAIGIDRPMPVTVIRRSDSAGPGNARNLGIAQVSACIIVFVDAGVIVTADQLDLLTRELSVGDTVAVAPRIRSEDRPTRLAGYETRWSPLDLGPEPGLVASGRPTSYVPSTCLAVWSSVLAGVGGFDPGLRFGEDVDLVWRLGAAGWVRYVPHIEVSHPPRSSLTGFVRQRISYGTSAGPLAKRHGWTVAPARLDRRSAVSWGAMLSGFLVPGGLAAGWSTVKRFAALVDVGLAPIRAARMVAEGWIGMANGLAMATARTWWPIAVVTARYSRFRLLAVLLVLGWLRRLRRRPRCIRGTMDTDTIIGTGIDLALGVVDDSAYALGVWRGAIATRTAQPLLPHLPAGGDPTGR